MENHYRNPLLILIFTFLGMLIRYSYFYIWYSVIGRPIKKIDYYSNGFKEVIYNILLTLFAIMGFILWMVYDIVNQVS